MGGKGEGGTLVIVDMLRETNSHTGPRKSSHVAENPSKQENDGLRAWKRGHEARTTPYRVHDSVNCIAYE